MKKIFLLLALASGPGPVAAEPKASGTAGRSAYQSVMLTDYCQRLTHNLRRAVAGKGEAMREIGEFYQNGEGLSRNAARAKEWYEKAVAAGADYAYPYIARLYEEGGPGLEKDYARAKEWYEKAIAAGDLDGNAAIARLYEEGGPGLEKDWVRACSFYKKDGWGPDAQRVCPKN